MSPSNWFRRLFSPSADVQPAGDDAALHEEYGGEVVEQPGPSVVTGGAPGLAGLEDAKAAEDAIAATDPPPDPAP
jgi:hypothetical protein